MSTIVRPLLAVIERRHVIMFALALLVLLVIAFVGITNRMTTLGLELSKIEQEIDARQRIHDDLQLDIAAVQSFSSSAATRDLVPVASVTYLVEDGRAVAVR